MDAYEKMQNASYMMLEAFKDFKEVFESLADRGEGIKAPTNHIEEVKPMKGSMEAIEDAFKYLLGEEDWDGDCEVDFPAQPHFKYEDINGEDSRFWGGMEIGIPYAVAVKNSDGQGMLIPIQNGLFGKGY